MSTDEGFPSPSGPSNQTVLRSFAIHRRSEPDNGRLFGMLSYMVRLKKLGLRLELVPLSNEVTAFRQMLLVRLLTDGAGSRLLFTAVTCTHG